MKLSSEDQMAVSITLSRVVIEALLSKGVITEQDLKNALTTVDFDSPLTPDILKVVSALFVSLPGDSKPGQ